MTTLPRSTVLRRAALLAAGALSLDLLPRSAPAATRSSSPTTPDLTTPTPQPVAFDEVWIFPPGDRGPWNLVTIMPQDTVLWRPSDTTWILSRAADYYDRTHPTITEFTAIVRGRVYRLSRYHTIPHLVTDVQGGRDGTAPIWGVQELNVWYGPYGEGARS